MFRFPKSRINENDGNGIFLSYKTFLGNVLFLRERIFFGKRIFVDNKKIASDAIFLYDS